MLHKNLFKFICFQIQNLKRGLGLDMAIEIIAEISQLYNFEKSFIASSIDELENDFLMDITVKPKID